MFGPSKEHLAVLERLQALLGGLQQLNQQQDLGTWWFVGQYRGRDVRIGFADHHQRFTGIIYASPLGSRPIQCSIEATYATSLTLPRIDTGDPAFEARMRVYGAPTQVVAAALDAPTRRWLLDSHPPPKIPQISTEEGFLGIYRSYANLAGGVRVPGAQIPEPAELAQGLDAALALSDRLTGAFDGLFQAIQSQQGQGAAQHWLAAQYAEAAQREKSGARTRRWIIGIVIAICVSPMLILFGYFAIRILLG